MSETRYSARFRFGPTLIEQNAGQTVSVVIDRNGQAPTMTTPLFTLYEPGGAVLVDGSAGAVSGGTITSPTITAGSTASKTLGKNWLVKFTATIDGEARDFYNEAALVLARLYCPVAQGDLVDTHSDLIALMPSNLTSYQSYIDAAWGKVLRKLYRDSIPFWRLRSPSAMFEPVHDWALHLIFKDFKTLLDPADVYDELAAGYKDDFGLAYEGAKSKIDNGEDNTLSEEANPVSSVILLQATSRTGRVSRARSRARRRR